MKQRKSEVRKSVDLFAGNFDFNFTSLPLDSLKRIEHSVNRLRSIADELNHIDLPIETSDLISDVYNKFKHSFDLQFMDLTSKELRVLTYHLDYSEKKKVSIFKSERELTFFLKHLEINWKESFVLGLFDCMMKKWESSSRDSLFLIHSFIERKINDYDGGRKILRSIQSNWKYFDLKNGNLLLGKELSVLKVPIYECANFIGLSKSNVNYDYFSKTILAYYESEKSNLIHVFDYIEQVLSLHNKQITSKRLISRIIKQVNSEGLIVLQDKVKKAAFQFIGDPEIKSAWTFINNASKEDISVLNEARNILNEWLTKQFIEIFFITCCSNDARRKKFWLSYTDKISSFKFFGPENLRKRLKRDQRIAEYVDSRFSSVESNVDVSAFMLKIKNYTFIEFSNVGYACYAYKNNSRLIPEFSRKMNSVDELRNGGLPFAITSSQDNFELYEEGRLTHSANWEYKFNVWINNMVF